jgi:glycosyltransferase involved in cell wall biosynthesis
MKKNILLFSSKKHFSHTFCSILNSLSLDYNLSLYGVKGSLFNYFKEKKWNRKHISLYKNLFSINKISFYLFIFIKPFLQLFLFIKLSFLKYKKKYDSIFLLNLNEKILISPLAKFLKINTIWIEADNSDYSNLNKKILHQYIKFAKQNKIICLNEIFKIKIKSLGIPSENIYVINPGIKKKHKKYQENIFSKIAKNENNQVGKKFFTIGTITDLNDKTKIETLFSAFKNSMDIIPRMQLILVGEGEYSPDKNPWAKWLAKKMGIETMVWFVTDARNIKKWLDSFDIFMLSSKMLNLDDFKTCLYAMESGLAPIVPSGIGYESLVNNAKNGYFYDINNSLSLSEHIIKCYKNKHLQVDLGQNAKKTVENHFQITKTIEEFKKLI